MGPTRAQTRANYDRLSRWYDLFSGGAERALRREGIRALAVQQGERLVEIGAGTGAALVELAQAAGPEGLVVGVDLSPGMCRITQLRLVPDPRPIRDATDCRVSRSRSATGTVRTDTHLRAAAICGDATHAPLATGVFDAAFMSFTLELFDEGDMSAVLAECWRVLRPGGRLGVVAMAEPVRATPMTRLYAWSHARFPTTVDCRPIAVSQVLARGGFRVERLMRRSLWGLPVEVAVCRAPG
jgi:ubiquinone/menaquinone biosynthesis C-methylase UbiE